MSICIENKTENLQKNFDDSLKISDRSELKAYLMLRKLPSLSSVKHTSIDYWKNKYNCELNELPEECDFILNGKHGLELKSLEGSYPTLCIERWKDDGMKYEPGWIKSTKSGLLKYVMFHRRSTDEFYLFEASSLYEYIKFNGKLTRAQNGNSDDSGWLKLVDWENKNAGFLCKVSC